MKQEPEQNPIREGVINRYQRKVLTIDNDSSMEEGDCDVVYIDRVTGEEVMRYDGADPANSPPLGPSDAECFANKGLDINEEIPVSRCKKKPSDADIASYVWRQSQVVEKEQETERGTELLGELDLFSYLDLDAANFDFQQYAEHEKTMLQPALERKGFTRIAFFMGEQDSFGPLSRGIRAWREDKGYIFYYG